MPKVKTIIIGGCWNCIYLRDKLEKFNSNDLLINRSMTALRDYLLSLGKYNIILILDNPYNKLNSPYRLINNRLNIYTIADFDKVKLSEEQFLLNNKLRHYFSIKNIVVVDQQSSYVRKILNV